MNNIVTLMAKKRYQVIAELIQTYKEDQQKLIQQRLSDKSDKKEKVDTDDPLAFIFDVIDKANSSTKENIFRQLWPELVDKTVDACPTISIGLLPEEILLYIILYLPRQDLLKNIPYISHQWLRLSQDKEVWKSIITTSFIPELIQIVPFDKEKDITYLRYCQRLLILWKRLDKALTNTEQVKESNKHFKKTGSTILFSDAETKQPLKLLENIFNQLATKISGAHDQLLQAACLYGFLPAVLWLLAHGAEMDKPDKKGVTPLHRAIASNSSPPDIVALLLAAGADPNYPTIKGHAPLHTAARNGRTKCIELLLAHGAKVNLANPFDDKTALDWATEEGREIGIQLLLSAVEKKKSGAASENQLPIDIARNDDKEPDSPPSSPSRDSNSSISADDETDNSDTDSDSAISDISDSESESSESSDSESSDTVVPPTRSGLSSSINLLPLNWLQTQRNPRTTSATHTVPTSENSDTDNEEKDEGYVSPGCGY